MAIARYGVLKGRVIDALVGEGHDPHYQIHVVDETTDYRVAVNIKSQEAPSELEYLVDASFEHAVTEVLNTLPLGFHKLASEPGGVALDFIRSNLFHPSEMIKMPFGVATPEQLGEKIDGWVQHALHDEKAVLYAFGQRWGPEDGKKDPYFGFLPGNGVHDIHMNQGNDGGFVKADGVYQDGALLLQFPASAGAGFLWVAIFLKFQSQPWHTDDVTGHAIVEDLATPAMPVDNTMAPPVGQPARAPLGPQRLANRPVGVSEAIRIVAATLKSAAGARDNVTLLNGSPDPVDLTGWSIANTLKQKAPLPSATIDAGSTLRIQLPEEVSLPSGGGIVTLLDPQGMKVHGVSYTRNQARRRGWSIVF